MLIPRSQIAVFTLHSATDENGTGVAVDTWTPDGGSYTTLTLQVSALAVGTVTLQATVDGTNWIPILAENVSTGALSNALTVGIWRMVVVGFRQVRVALTDYSDDELTVVGVAVA